jgi:hypothetical protein
MRCEQVRRALLDARYGEPAPDATAHVTGCSDCAAFAAGEAALDAVLAVSQPAVAPADFDTRFSARLETERTRLRSRKQLRVVWAIVPLAAAFALLVSRHAGDAARIESANKQDVGLAMDLELVRNIDVVSKLDELEAYDVLSELDESELVRIAQEDK